MPNDNVLMISRALLQDLFDDVSDYACSREFRAKEKAWRDDLLARVRSLLTAYPGAPEMVAAHPGQLEPRAEVTGDLLRRCQELLELKKRGQHPQHALRALADTYDQEIPPHVRLSMAEYQTHVEAMRALVDAARTGASS
ncbi:TPA: hypothetical protein QDB10_003070 [Burkholderia vietnamiensis]|nr:hypothetical protein [Burkholderia vietnamiensis]